MTPPPVFPSTSDLIAWWARVAPERVAIVDRTRGGRHTYADLFMTIQPRDHRLIGAVLVPLNWRLSVAELARVIDDAAPALIVGEDRHRSLGEAGTKAAESSVQWLELDREAVPLLAVSDAVGGVAWVSSEPEAPAMLLYTSGSTGKPKGAILSDLADYI